MGKLLLIACTSVGRAMIECIMREKELSGIALVGIVNLRTDAAITKANYDGYTDLIAKYHLNHYYCRDVNEEACIKFIKKCAPDIIIQSGWSQKFGKELLGIPKYACIGQHPSPLPKGRGAACVNWAIITGEREWGNSFFRMEEMYDTGPVYAQERFTIELYDDVKSVYDKAADSSVRILRTCLNQWINGVFEETSQNDLIATHYPRRKPSDGKFDFGQGHLEIYNQIRGQTKPYPGAFFIMEVGKEQKKVIAWSSSLDSMEKEDGGWNILCGDDEWIRLLRIQVEGYPEIWAKDLFRFIG